MKKRRAVIARSVLTALVLFGCLSGCITYPNPAHAPRDRAFIRYWPATDRTRLRVAIKDNIDLKGVITTAGSRYLLTHGQPATEDAACLAGVRAQNVQIVGKTNLTEFAISPSGLNDYFGTPRSPFSHWPRLLIPGGSSSGSAVAVARGDADVGLGTDTAGSVRVPAACCGVVGLKTTFGLISTKGCFPVDPQALDTVGPIARTIADTVRGMDLLQPGFQAKYQAAVAAQPDGRRIRIGRLYLSGTDPKVDQAIDYALKNGPFHVIVLGPAFKDQWLQAKTDGDTMAAASVWVRDSQFLDKIGVAGRTLGTIIFGRLNYPGPYQQSLSRRPAWQHTLRLIFRQVDFIVVPTLKSRPPGVPWIFNKSALEARVLGDQNTVPVNFAGNPALAVPVPMDDKIVPVTSLQLIGPPKSEAALLNVGRIIEAKRPQLEKGIHSSATGQQSEQQSGQQGQQSG
ncbi:MAG: amidase [Verrucomicrobia bacterium]|nr:amidase [Verrucomicrobiota bacterium]